MTGVPAFRQLADELRSKIATGELPPGSQLPSMAQLRAQRGVSSTVVRDALNELRREGLIVGQQGKGVFVSETAEIALQPTNDERDLMRRLGDMEQGLRDLGERVAELEGRKSS